MWNRFGLLILAGLLLSGSVNAFAQKHYDSPWVSFEVPSGWHTEENSSRPSAIRIKSDTLPAFILIFLDSNLPADLRAVTGSPAETRAVAEMASFFPAMRIRVEQGCKASTEVSFDNRNAVACLILATAGGEDRSYLSVFGLPVRGTRAMLLFFSTVDAGDVSTLQAGSSTVMDSIHFKEPGEWSTYSSASFSFMYPPTWTVHEHGQNEAWASDGGARGFSIRYMPGLANHADRFNQCASMDDLLTEVYEKEFMIEETPKNQYPYTSVTHDNFMPGLMGGKETWIDKTLVEAYKKPVTQEFWVNAVPRATGVYLVTYMHPAEPMQTSEPIRKELISRVKFVSGALDKKAYCNYLGQ